MSASNEWTEWHLTPRGWEEGASLADINVSTHRPTPEDRVLTFKYRESMSSMYSGVDVSQTELWRSDDAISIERLLKQFGPAPRRL